MAWRSLLHLQAGDEVAAQVEVLQATQHAQAAELREAITGKVQSPQVGKCRETIEALQEVAVQVQDFKGPGYLQPETLFYQSVCMLAVTRPLLQ